MSRRPSCSASLGEPMRWRIVELLADEELCVCHLVEALEVAQPLVSHHLRVLRDAGLVETSAAPVLDLLPAASRAAGRARQRVRRPRRAHAARGRPSPAVLLIR